MVAHTEQRRLNAEQLAVVSQAVATAEDLISDWFRLTLSTWKKYRYDIKTMKDLQPEEVVDEVFAQIVRYSRPERPDGLRRREFYCICLQDHNILHALDREPQLALHPLMLYVLTHELIHLVRFYKFFVSFDAYEHHRDAEEALVHRLTHDLLSKAKIANMSTIFDFYADHRRPGPGRPAFLD